MKVWIAHVTNDSGDHYLWAYKDKPTHEQVITRLWESEQAEELQWYLDTCGATIVESEVR